MIRVLYVHGGTLLYGGTEAYMMNFYRRFDRGQVQVDFVVHGDARGVYDDEIERLGGSVFHVPVKGQDYRGNTRALREIMEQGQYAAVHAHTDANNAHVLQIAKECGVPLRISHSHNTRTQSDSRLRRLYNGLEKRRIPYVATHLFACSEPAGRWLYGRQPFVVIPNAIEIERFAFDSVRREEMRRQLGLTDQLVVGHVGRFSFQKNHPFLLEIFAEMANRRPDATLLLIGDGENRERIERLIRLRGLKERVRIVPPTPRVADYMQAMDVFLLPSHFEGFAVVLVEAQTAGLPCFASLDAVPNADLTGLVSYISLSEPPSVWAEQVLRQPDTKREDAWRPVADAGYDIAAAAERLQRFYLTGEYV